MWSRSECGTNGNSDSVPAEQTARGGTFASMPLLAVCRLAVFGRERGLLLPAPGRRATQREQQGGTAERSHRRAARGTVPADGTRRECRGRDARGRRLPGGDGRARLVRPARRKLAGLGTWSAGDGAGR